ncbi:MAG: putative oxidoreductase [Maribacter sp.]|jgi:putative oxidoreductase
MKKTSILFHPLFEHPLSIIRICIGIGFIIQGLNVFNTGFMDGHISIFSGMHDLPMPAFLAYLSKGGELIFGIMLVLGLFTRLASLMLIINMSVATFYALGGDILSIENYQAQISWFYLLVGIALFLSGPTGYSLDEKLTRERTRYQSNTNIKRKKPSIYRINWKFLIRIGKL